MAKSSFARPPGSPTAPPPPSRTAPLPPPRATAPAPPPPPARRPAPPTPSAEAQVEFLPPAGVAEVQQEAPAPSAPPRRTRGPNKPKEETQLAVQQTNHQLAVPTASGIPRVGEIRGEVDATDLQFPQLKIASAVGPLSLLDPPVPPGTIVVGAGDQWNYLWQEGCEPVGVTLIWTDKGYSQKTNEQGQNLYDLEEQGSTFYGLDAKTRMQEANGTLDAAAAISMGKKLFEPLMMCHVLVRMPEGLQDDFGMFNIEIPGVGGLYMAAMWYIRGSAYSECAKKIFSEAKGVLAKGSIWHEFAMDGKYIRGSKNAWWIPRIRNGAENSPELANYLLENA